MSIQRRVLIPALLAAAAVGVTGFTAARSHDQLVLGAPEAQVTKVDHRGAAAIGDAVNPLPMLRPAPDARTHHVRLDLTHKMVEVAPGVKLEAWTFGDSIPGPTVHVRQGDKVVFTMTNRSHEAASVMPPMPHSIDFHSAMVSPHDKYRSIGPGETITFEWTANYPGVFMYHCGTPMLLHHMLMGMYGAVVVDPAEGWPDKVDREYVLVQSEIYGKPKDPKQPNVLVADMEAAMRKQPKYVVFNGAVGKHEREPLEAKPGERVRLYVLNAGPNDTSSFHVVGTIFDKVYLDGNPKNLQRGLQTVLLGSSNGAVVEFIVPEDGLYHFVDHEFTDASRGAVGNLGSKKAPAPAAAAHEHHH